MTSSNATLSFDDVTQGISLTIDAAPVIADVWALEQGLFGFEQARLGNPNHAHFAIFLRNDKGDLQGGVDCHIMWRRVFIKTLWVAEAVRGRGLGTRLMNAAEAEAIRRKCLSMWLTALGDRANHFYARLEYRIFGIHDDYVDGEALYSLAKTLVY